MEKKTCNKPLCDLNHGCNVTYRWYILVFYVVFPWERRDSTNKIIISFHEINFTEVGPSQENILSSFSRGLQVSGYYYCYQYYHYYTLIDFEITVNANEFKKVSNNIQ